MSRLCLEDDEVIRKLLLSRELRQAVGVGMVRRFRRTFYLTLMAACAALGHAEYALLPETAFVAVLVLGVLGLLYRYEPVWARLSIPAANRLGLALGLAALLWAGGRVYMEWLSPQMHRTDWTLLLVALLGPLVMVLLPAKLLRADKHIGDYWWLHGLSLAAASLAAAMAEEMLTCGLVLVYVAAAVWNWVLLERLRLTGQIRPLPGSAVPPPEGVRPNTNKDKSLRCGLASLALAAAAASPLYLLTPPSPLPKGSFGKPRMEIGYAAEQMLDLTQTGSLASNPAVAFEVRVWRMDGSPGELPPHIRWRGRELQRYTQGIWESEPLRLPTILPTTRDSTPWRPPRLGRQQLVLEFRLRPDILDFILADPVAWVPLQPPPIVSAIDGRIVPWYWLGDGTFFIDLPDSLQHPYVQHWHPPSPADMSPPFLIAEPDPFPLLRPLVVGFSPQIQQYTREVLQELVRTGRLPAAALDPTTQRLRPEFHKQAAEQLCLYLRRDAGLRYTLDIQRQQQRMDPVEDFLFHTRAGHCERFASALTLMLRSQGIPAQVVIGFQGAEPADEPGLYRVRHAHAHAWVECLIEHYEPLQPGWRPISRWLSLDPTPDAELLEEGNWWQRGRQQVRQWFRNYVVDYPPELRRATLQQLQDWLVRNWSVWMQAIGLVLAAMVAMGVIRRVYARRLDMAHNPHQWPQLLEPLIRLFEHYGIVLEKHHTLVDWSRRTTAFLADLPESQRWIEFIQDYVNLYHVNRFGKRLLPAAAEERLHRGLIGLHQFLQQATTAPPSPQGPQIPS